MKSLLPCGNSLSCKSEMVGKYWKVRVSSLEEMFVYCNGPK